MDYDHSDLQSIGDSGYILNITCDHDYVPPATEYIDSLGVFGIAFVSLGTILMAVTVYLAVDSSYSTLYSKESGSFKRNVLLIMSVYPIASLCSLVALSVPRAQLLSEAVTQIFLTIALYRLYLLLIDVGRREVKKSPPLRLRVGPCCCWPCLPFAEREMNPVNLSWLQVVVLQLPIVQTLIYCVFIFASAEDAAIIRKYGMFLQPLSITSILLGLYGVTITMKSLQEVNPGSNLRHKTTVVQMVLLFSKFQGFIVKSLPMTGLFPCNPPITPQLYANFTYNALMLIEMLFLCYAARLVYGERTAGKEDTEGGFAGVPTPRNNSLGTGDDDTKSRGNGTDLERLNDATNNNNENRTGLAAGQQVQLSIRLAGVTA